MTDNTQELDEILFNLCDLSYASFTTQREADRVADQLDYDRDEAKQAINAWHNKQVESELKSIYGELGHIRTVRECIDDRLAERNKLKEAEL